MEELLQLPQWAATKLQNIQHFIPTESTKFVATALLNLSSG